VRGLEIRAGTPRKGKSPRESEVHAWDVQHSWSEGKGILGEQKKR